MSSLEHKNLYTHAQMEQLDIQLLSLLEEAVQNNEYVEDEIGEQVANLHKQWLLLNCDSYSCPAHRALVQSYVTDPQIKAHYDQQVEGCANFLKCAVEYHMV